MEVFVSYRRLDWAFAHPLVKNLRKHLCSKIFIDHDGIDKTDFEESILSHLKISDAVLVIISRHTFDKDRIFDKDDWVRREIRLTLELDKPIILVRINGIQLPAQNELPSDISAVLRKEAKTIYPNHYEEGVNKLAKFIATVTPIRLGNPVMCFLRKFGSFILLATAIVVIVWAFSIYSQMISTPATIPTQTVTLTPNFQFTATRRAMETAAALSETERANENNNP